MKYLYYALFTENEQGQYEVEFPDFSPHVATFGDNMSDALKMARDALSGYLLVLEDSDDSLPPTTPPGKITVPKNSLLIPIEVDTTLAREREENILVKKTLVIPKYLNELAKDEQINFSAALTEALKDKLDI